jgi:Cysteine rich repeat
MVAKLIRTVVLVATVALPALALAQGAPPVPPPGEGGAPGHFAKVRAACRADVERLCKDVKPGEGRIRECLKTHAAELSDSCKAAIREAREHHHPRD